jgi:hypothetical protein
MHPGRVAVLLLAFVLSAPSTAAQFSFAAFGDMPYNEWEEVQIVSIIGEMNREKLAFSMHVGDFKLAQVECSDGVYLQRREWFGLSHHPFVYIPGDNDWYDCGRALGAARDPLERLAKLRELFFSADTMLGQRPLRLERQEDRGFPEHQRWMIDDVVFATLNVPGPNNNRRQPQESKPRTAALLDWMRETFSIARTRKLPAVVIALHANLWTGNPAFAEILAALADEAQAYSGSVLVVHGDTHWYRFDKPLIDPKSGRTIANVTRLEVFGSPFVNWSHVTVTTGGGKARFEAVHGTDLAARRAR